MAVSPEIRRHGAIRRPTFAINPLPLTLAPTERTCPPREGTRSEPPVDYAPFYKTRMGEKFICKAAPDLIR